METYNCVGENVILLDGFYSKPFTEENKEYFRQKIERRFRQVESLKSVYQFNSVNYPMYSIADITIESIGDDILFEKSTQESNPFRMNNRINLDKSDYDNQLIPSINEGFVGIVANLQYISGIESSIKTNLIQKDEELGEPIYVIPYSANDLLDDNLKCINDDLTVTNKTITTGGGYFKSPKRTIMFSDDVDDNNLRKIFLGSSLIQMKISFKLIESKYNPITKDYEVDKIFNCSNMYSEMDLECFIDGAVKTFPIYSSDLNVYYSFQNDEYNYTSYNSDILNNENIDFSIPPIMRGGNYLYFTDKDGNRDISASSKYIIKYVKNPRKTILDYNKLGIPVCTVYHMAQILDYEYLINPENFKLAWWFGIAMTTTPTPDPDPDPDPEDEDIPVGNRPDLPNGDGVLDDRLDNEDSDPIIFPDVNIGLGNGLINNYIMNETEIGILGNNFFDSNLFATLPYNPLDYIVSLRAMPFDLISKVSWQIVNKIYFGKSEIDCTTSMITNSNKIDINMGSLTVNELFENFIDYDLVDVSMYLPYLSFVNLNVKEIMGKTLNVIYTIDIDTGTFIAKILVDNILINTYDGVMGVEIPLNANVQASKVLGTITSASALGVGLLTGNVLAMGGGALGLAKSLNENTSTANKTVQPMTSFYMPQVPFLKFNYKMPLINSDYFDLNGYSFEKVIKLSEVSGYTEISKLQLDYAKATEKELEEIEKLLRGGIFI